jgi:hypothetical protein
MNDLSKSEEEMGEVIFIADFFTDFFLMPIETFVISYYFIELLYVNTRKQ